MKVIFRDLNSSGIVPAVRELFPDWDVACGDIFSSGQRADIVVSPANITGRMDGGIDQVYINRFGWQLEARLMRDILNVHHGKLPIGEARLITTYDERVDAIPLMICAPTMAWPPHDVSRTQNAYLAFRATLVCALTEGVKALGREPVLLVPGLGTATGRMLGPVCAAQMRRAWDEVMANPPRQQSTPMPARAAGPVTLGEAINALRKLIPHAYAEIGSLAPVAPEWAAALSESQRIVQRADSMGGYPWEHPNFVGAVSYDPPLPRGLGAHVHGVGVTDPGAHSHNISMPPHA